MISNQFMSKLREFNLNSYESKIWVALLSKGSTTAGNLSEVTDVPRSRCYDVLESLEKKGFIIMKVGRPIKYVAVEPQNAIERVKERLQEETENQLKAFEELKGSLVVKELNKLLSLTSDSQKPEDMTGLIKTKRNINNHFSSMFKEASEILLATDSQSLINKAKLLKNSTAKIKILTDKGYKKNPELQKIAEVKIASSVGRFCVTDKAAAMFLTDASQTDDSFVWINSQYSISTLRDLFHNKWNK